MKGVTRSRFARAWERLGFAVWSFLEVVEAEIRGDASAPPERAASPPAGAACSAASPAPAPARGLAPLSTPLNPGGPADATLCVVRRLGTCSPKAVAAELGISRPAARYRLKVLLQAGLLSARGTRRSRRYWVSGGPPPPPATTSRAPAPAAGPSSPPPPTETPEATEAPAAVPRPGSLPTAGAVPRPGPPPPATDPARTGPGRPVPPPPPRSGPGAPPAPPAIPPRDPVAVFAARSARGSARGDSPRPLGESRAEARRSAARPTRFSGGAARGRAKAAGWGPDDVPAGDRKTLEVLAELGGERVTLPAFVRRHWPRQAHQARRMLGPGRERWQRAEAHGLLAIETTPDGIVATLTTHGVRLADALNP